MGVIERYELLKAQGWEAWVAEIPPPNWKEGKWPSREQAAYLVRKNADRGYNPPIGYERTAPGPYLKRIALSEPIHGERVKLRGEAVRVGDGWSGFLRLLRTHLLVLYTGDGRIVRWRFQIKLFPTSDARDATAKRHPLAGWGLALLRHYGHWRG
jgi:hypothetical protein